MAEREENRINYLAVVHGQLIAPQGRAIEDGRALASQCLTQLEQYQDPEQFPPRLLILLASSAYLETVDPGQLIEGIHQTFAEYLQQNDLPPSDVPLLGSSVAAVVFKQPDSPNRVHERGAVLICLASRLIEAQVAVGTDARSNPSNAIQSLLGEIRLSGRDPNPLADRILLTFFPGFGKKGSTPLYAAPELHRALRAGVRARIRIAGGVASANKGNIPVLFAGREVLTDAVVAARVTTGVPIGIGFEHGLTPTGRVVRVSKLGKDKYTIAEFNGDQQPAELLREVGGFVLMGKLSTAGEPQTAVPRIASDGQSIKLRCYGVSEGDHFEFLRPEHERTLTAIVDCVKQSQERILIKKPLVGLLLICNAWRLFYHDAGLDIEQTLARLEAETGLPCLGGFVDGEAGEDTSGRSVFGNGGVTGLVFGDEKRERTPLHRGFRALAEYTPRMTSTESIEEAIDEALRIIVEAGFRGAMLSLVLKDGEHEYVKAIGARGKRFRTICDEICLLLRTAPAENEYLASRVVREARDNLKAGGRFIEDSRDPKHGCNQAAVEKAGLISMYVAPLRQLHDRVLGVLHVDLGEVKELGKREQQVLDSLAAIIGASLNRLLNWSEADIGRKLDPALLEGLSRRTVEAGSQHLIEKAVEAFGVEIGHLRLTDPNRDKLIMVAGVGPCFAEALKVRPIRDFGDNSPICTAYRHGGVTIVNRTATDSDYQQMRRDDFGAHPLLYEALGQMKSYAAISFENEDGKKLGALSLGSYKEWVFSRHHEMALRALAKRVGFLVEHFNNKGTLQFLINAGPRLADIRELSDLSGELAKALRRFCEQAQAQWGSVFLLDEDRKCYVLRAEYGWRQPDWVHAARYNEDDDWAGAGAKDNEPAIIPDLYQARGSQPRYTQQIFGFELSPEKTVESIGLLLQVGGKKLGYLTMHRPKDGVLSGFAVQNKEALIESASGIAGLVHVLRSNRERQWRETEARRRQEVYNQLARQGDERAFETKVCQEMLRSFRARQAHFYRIEEVDNETRVFWVEGYHRSAKAEAFMRAEPPAPDSAPLALIAESVLDNRAVAGRPTIRVERLKINGSQPSGLSRVGAEGLVTRACVPIISKHKLLGILDLHWVIGAEQLASSDVEHNEGQLLVLGSMVGSAYRGHQLKAKSELPMRAVQGAGAIALQHAHRLGHIVQHLLDLAQSIKDNPGACEQEVDGILGEARNAKAVMKSLVIDYGERMLKPLCENHSVHTLVSQALRDLSPKEQECIREGVVCVNQQIGAEEAWQVYVDSVLTKQALINVLDNAVKAIQDKCEKDGWEGNGKEITISANLAVDGKSVEIDIADTGVGMSDERERAAFEGSLDTNGHRGVGILITRNLLYCQGGNLTYDREGGVGTRAVITLPLVNRGDRLCLTI